MFIPATLEKLNFPFIKYACTVYRYSLFENTAPIAERNILIVTLAKVEASRGVLGSVKFLTF